MAESIQTAVVRIERSNITVELPFFLGSSNLGSSWNESRQLRQIGTFKSLSSSNRGGGTRIALTVGAGGLPEPEAIADTLRSTGIVPRGMKVRFEPGGDTY